MSVQCISTTMCSICRDDESTAPLAAVSGSLHPVPHHFHLDCIRPWIDQLVGRGIAATCPLCRLTIERIIFDDGAETTIPTPEGRDRGDAPQFTADGVRALINQAEIPQNTLGLLIRFAIESENDEIIETVFESGQLWEERQFRFLLVTAAESGQLRYVQTVLEYGAEYGAVPMTSRMNAALAARRRGHYTIASYLCRGCGIPTTTAVAALVGTIALFYFNS